jgi:hypothetical protein
MQNSPHGAGYFLNSNGRTVLNTTRWTILLIDDDVDALRFVVERTGSLDGLVQHGGDAIWRS